MRSVVRKLVLVSITLHTTQQITVLNLPLTIFQMIAIATLCVGICDLLRRNYLKKGTYLLYATITVISACVALAVSVNRSWATSLFLLNILMAGMFVLIANYFTADDCDCLLKAFIQSQYITILVSIYGAYQFTVYNRNVSDIDMGIIHWSLSESFDTFGQAAGKMRLFAPYNTGPVLSAVMGMCIVILLLNKRLFLPKQRIGLVISFFVILLLTGSRTGMLMLFVTLILYGILMKRISKKLVYILLICTALAAAVSPQLLKGEYLVFMLKRFGEFDLELFMMDRHLLVPLDGLIIWLSSMKNFLIGIGFGSSLYMSGAHTYLPAHFLNNYVTLIAERGLFGLCLVVILFWCVYKEFRNADEKDTSKAVRWAMVVGLLCGLTYETMNCYFYQLLIGVVLMLDTGRKRGKANGNNVSFRNYSGLQC